VELRYNVEVLSEGREARSALYLSAADRVLAVLPNSIDDALTVREIGDFVARDATGRGGLKHGTIRVALNRDLEGRVDRDEALGDVRWWRDDGL
jgi:hypothetical protein